MSSGQMPMSCGHRNLDDPRGIAQTIALLIKSYKKLGGNGYGGRGTGDFDGAV